MAVGGFGLDGETAGVVEGAIAVRSLENDLRATISRMKRESEIRRWVYQFQKAVSSVMSWGVMGVGWLLSLRIRPWGVR